jgi:hypothetical protein
MTVADRLLPSLELRSACGTLSGEAPFKVPRRYVPQGRHARPTFTNNTAF